MVYCDSFAALFLSFIIITNLKGPFFCSLIISSGNILNRKTLEIKEFLICELSFSSTISRVFEFL